MKNFLFILAIFIIGCVQSKNIVSIEYKEVIQLYEHRNIHYINVTLNSLPASLIVDTGASKSMLDINQAKYYEFGFKILIKDQYVGLGGLQNVYAVYDYEVNEFFVPFVGTDLDEITKFFRNDGVNIVGILGSDFLSLHNMVIDFNKDVMYKKKISK